MDNLTIFDTFIYRDSSYLCDMNCCECIVKGMKCSIYGYGCNKEYLSGLSYSKYSVESDCCIPYTNTIQKLKTRIVSR